MTTSEEKRARQLSRRRAYLMATGRVDEAHEMDLEARELREQAASESYRLRQTEGRNKGAFGYSGTMKVALALLFAVAMHAQTTLTISAQRSPFPLAKGLTLYSAEVCSVQARTISAAQIRQAAENSGISFQDPALNSGALATAASKTPTSRALTVVKWSSVGLSVASGVVTYIKSQSSTPGNAKTWAEITIGTGALGAGIGILQPILQADVNTQAVAITTGVQAALISDMTTLYAIAGGGCGKSVMFFGNGPTILSVIRGTIP